MARDVFLEKFQNCDSLKKFLEVFQTSNFLSEHSEVEGLTKDEIDSLIKNEQFLKMIFKYCKDETSAHLIFNNFTRVFTKTQISNLVSQQSFMDWVKEIVSSLGDSNEGIDKNKNQILKEIIVFFEFAENKDFLIDSNNSFLWKIRDIAQLMRDGLSRDQKAKFFDYLLDNWKSGMVDMVVLKGITFGNFLENDKINVARREKLTSIKNMMFLVSNPLLNKCLESMKANDFKHNDYKKLLKRCYGAELTIPYRFFNNEMVDAYLEIKDPIVSLTILNNLKRFNYMGAELLEVSRRNFLFNKKFKTSDNVCEYFFKDSANNTQLNTKKMHHFAIISKIYRDYLKEGVIKDRKALYTIVETKLEAEMVETLFSILKQKRVDDYSEILYDDIAKARELTTNDFAKNIANFRTIKGVKKEVIDKVNVYELTGQDFTILVRRKGGVISCYAEQIKEFFRNDKNWVMSSTLISDNSLKIFNPEALNTPMENIILYGFSEIKAEYISIISTEDCWTKNNITKEHFDELDADSPFLHYVQKAVPFWTYKGFQKKCLYNNRYQKGYNEIIVVPYERGNEGEEFFMPDCIVLFRTASQKGKPLKDIINPKVAKAAKDLGIDIVIIDYEIYQKQITDKINNIDEEKIARIVELGEYSQIIDQIKLLEK